MEKILIIGAKGNLGVQLARVFADSQPLSWDLPENDFLDFAGLDKALDLVSPKVIINAAAYNAVDKCEADEEEYALALKLNRDLPQRLGKWCLDNGARLIHYSTDYVFSGTADNPEFAEDSETNPINRYGASKEAGEKAVLESGKQGLAYYLIRVSKLFGPSGPGSYSKKSFFDIMQSLAQTKKELTVVDEEASRFTYTPDLAEATKRLVDEGYPSGIYHLANEGIATWYEAVLALKDITRWPEDVRIVPILGSQLDRPAARPAFSALKNTKAPLMRRYEEALEEFINR